MTDRLPSSDASLPESRDVLALAMRGGRMGAWSRNLESGEVWWSRQLEELFGLPPGGFEGTETGFFAFVHPDDRVEVERAVGGAIASHEDYLVEFRFQHAQAGWRWMEGRGRAVYTADGTPRFLYGIGIDITERKHTEETLARARALADAGAERLSLALAAASLGDWSWDARTDMVDCSVRAAEIFRIPPGPHMTWTEMRLLLHPDDRERARAAVQEAIAGRTGYSIEYRLVNDGRERWVAVSGRARYDGEDVLGMIGIIREITGNRLLVRLDDEVRPLTDPDQIASTAARLLGNHLDATRCAYAMIEPDEDAFVVTGNHTRDATSIVGRYTLRQFGDECRRLLRAGRPFVVHDCEADDRLTGPDRAAFAAMQVGAVLAVPLMKAGRLVAGVALHSRVPRRWRRGEVELAEQVASRCWESLERARVERERGDLLRAAEAANRAKDEFLAMLGHELRNPLSPIMTALHLMKLQVGPIAERERTIIERQVVHLTRLVDDLLDVSRIARGKVELHMALTELAEIIRDAIEVASPLLENGAHVLTVDVPAGLTVRADPGRLRQVISNLLTNAAKYTPAGGAISIAAGRDGDTVTLRVRDNGIGIASDLLPGVFEQFVQGRQSSDRSQGGLGLGLSIVRSLVERHGGRVSAHSDGPGTGSEFVVLLPFAAGSPADAGTPPALAMTAPHPHALRVLIVDDNEDAAEMLAHTLRFLGHQAHVAYDGPQALEQAAGLRPDVALLDIGLPGMDGYELAGRLKALFAGLRLIAVTGYGQDADRARAAAAGFDHHLVKPVDLDRLIGLLAPDTDAQRTEA